MWDLFWGNRLSRWSEYVLACVCPASQAPGWVSRGVAGESCVPAPRESLLSLTLEKPLSKCRWPRDGSFPVPVRRKGSEIARRHRVE